MSESDKALLWTFLASIVASQLVLVFTALYFVTRSLIQVWRGKK